jgi:hypothetical protein
LRFHYLAGGLIAYQSIRQALLVGGIAIIAHWSAQVVGNDTQAICSMQQLTSFLLE